MAKGQRNRDIRRLAFGDKKAARRIRKNRSHRSYDTVPLQDVLRGAIEARGAKSGLIIRTEDNS